MEGAAARGERGERGGRRWLPNSGAHPAESRSSARLIKLLEAPDFRSKLLHARQNPKGAVAQEILSVVVAFVNAAAVKVPWGHRERSAEVHALIAGQRAHGAAAIFYTCA